LSSSRWISSSVQFGRGATGTERISASFARARLLRPAWTSATLTR
jgi:hypothetical protein